jgi:hypothetical protein
MSSLPRKLWGWTGIGLTWAILWAAFAIVLVLIIGVLDPDSVDPGEGPLVAGAVFGGIGFLSGIGFAGLLSCLASGKAISEISYMGAALCGILASAVFPLLSGREDQVFLMCPLGGAIAAAFVAILRRATLRDSKRPKRLRDVLFGYVLALVRSAVGAPKESAS